MKSKTVWHDPVVAEIHAVREQLAAKYKNDLTAYSKAANKRCRELGMTVSEPGAHGKRRLPV